MSNHQREEEDRALMASVRQAVTNGVPTGALARTIRRWSSKWGVSDLTNTLSFRLNGRLRRTLARWVIRDECVELSPRFFGSVAEARAILCHELAHAAAVKKYGHQIRAHGREWSGLVLAAGFEPRAYNLKGRVPAVIHAVRRGQSYEHRCPVCHAVRYARKPVRAWRCAECVQLGLAGYLSVTHAVSGGGHH